LIATQVLDQMITSAPYSAQTSGRDMGGRGYEVGALFGPIPIALYPVGLS
jgi:hypothetical protein